ncbi:MAG: DUF5104 domain-containing protein [Clostridium sp.]|nr:DUF5104 domain-containing protein [Clostridium sp.]
MKKIEVFLCCVILCMNLGGCIRPMSRGEQLTKELGSEQQMADQMMEDIAAALDAGDADALKALFSETALEEATDIDQQISDLLEFYQGKKQSFEGDASSSTSTEYGTTTKKQLIGQYLLTTDKESYRVIYDYNVIDKENPDKVGLSQLELVPDELYQKDDFDFLCGNEGYEGPGVYMQE